MIPPYCPLCKVKHYPNEQHRPPFRPEVMALTTPLPAKHSVVEVPPVERTTQNGVGSELPKKRGRPKVYPDKKTRTREYMRRYREKKRHPGSS